MQILPQIKKNYGPILSLVNGKHAESLVKCIHFIALKHIRHMDWWVDRERDRWVDMIKCRKALIIEYKW